MGFFRRLINVGIGLAAAVTAGALMKSYQKKSLYEAEFRVLEDSEDPQNGENAPQE